MNGLTLAIDVYTIGSALGDAQSSFYFNPFVRTHRGLSYEYMNDLADIEFRVLSNISTWSDQVTRRPLDNVDLKKDSLPFKTYQFSLLFCFA